MFVNDIWYVAAWSDEVAKGPFGRRICDEEVVLYRTGDGTISALSGLCPHRFAPLRLGQVLNGERLQCPYHGLEFDASGNCVHNPHGAAPKAVRIASYPVVEKHGLIWIWRGEPNKADATLIPDFGCLTDPGFRTIGGAFVVQAHYELITDNLMDLTHVEYLHKGGLGNEAIHGSRHEVRQDGLTVHSNRLCIGATAPPIWQALSGYGDKPVDHWLDMRWDPPALMLLDVGVTLAGRPRAEGFRTFGLDILTPETATTTHYFWGATRDFGLDDPALDAQLEQAVATAFLGEDKPMLEEVQRLMGGRSFDAMRPLLLPFDEGAVRARRTVKQLQAPTSS